jgi:hypothetical protein
MLQDLTPAAFEAHQGTPFRIDLGGPAPLEVVLHEVKRHEPHPGARPEPFSVYFLGPRTPVLPQRIYKLEHDRMEIFLVPVGPDPRQDGMVYEAVFY